MEKLSEEDLVIATMERDRLILEGETRLLQLRDQIKYEYPFFSFLFFLFFFLPFLSFLFFFIFFFFFFFLKLPTNIARDLLTHRLTQEFYDSMEEHAVVLKSFKAKLQVPNYAVTKTAPEDLAKLEQIKALRRVEIRDFRIRQLEVREGEREEREERRERREEREERKASCKL
jgi:hypothetical protein